MTEFTIAELNIRSADATIASVAEKVVAALEDGTTRLIDFAGETPDDTTIRAVGHRTEDLP
jgi:hypothetical protein